MIQRKLISSYKWVDKKNKHEENKANKEMKQITARKLLKKSLSSSKEKLCLEN